MSLPHYYSRLGPFEDVFLTGLPILTYHHVAPIDYLKLPIQTLPARSSSKATTSSPANPSCVE